MSWEDKRSWHLMRPLVYYLRENFIPPAMAKGGDFLDFSAGLGDLSRYLVDNGANSVTATLPDTGAPESGGGVTWLEGVPAGSIAERLAGLSFDVATARMVFQFPTWEGDRADPDTMVEQLAKVLRPQGRLVIAFHQFRAFEPVPARGEPPTAAQALDNATGDLALLARVVRYLGLPPREGPMGETGFGLKIPMLVTTLQTHGFDIETADHPEPFTLPLDLDGRSEEEIVDLGGRVMDLKRRYLAEPEDSPYAHPQTVRRMLIELSQMIELVAWPIVRVVARLRD
ncbi:MAG: class I SAM-dependent methyltransferase [Acidimicrobiia bacterium]